MEQPGGEDLPERLHEVGERGLMAVLVEVPGGVEHGERGRREAAGDLAEVEAEEREVVDVGSRAGRARHVPEEQARRDAVREQGRDVGAGGHADEDVEVGDRDVLEPVLERRERADLVDRSRHAPARAHDRETLADGRWKRLERALGRSVPGCLGPGLSTLAGHQFS